MDNICDLTCSSELVLERHLTEISAGKVDKSESDHEVCERKKKKNSPTCNLVLSSEDKTFLQSQS